MVEGELACFHAIVEGYVQGVGFRYFVQEQAVRVGIKGWVRNRWDGSVEVLAEGHREKLEFLQGALSRGPHSALVSGVTLEWLPATGEFSAFSVRSTSS